MHQTGTRGGDTPPSVAKTDVLTESGRAGVPPRFLACVLLAAWCARGFAPPTPAQSGRPACGRRRPPSICCSLWSQHSSPPAVFRMGGNVPGAPRFVVVTLQPLGLYIVQWGRNQYYTRHTLCLASSLNNAQEQKNAFSGLCFLVSTRLKP